jgi:hypothetical protein
MSQVGSDKGRRWSVKRFLDTSSTLRMGYRVYTTRAAKKPTASQGWVFEYAAEGVVRVRNTEVIKGQAPRYLDISSIRSSTIRTHTASPSPMQVWKLVPVTDLPPIPTVPEVATPKPDVIKNKPQLPTTGPTKKAPKPTKAPTKAPKPTKVPEGGSCVRDSDCAKGRRCFRGVCYGGPHASVSIKKHDVRSGVYRIRVVGLSDGRKLKKPLYLSGTKDGNTQLTDAVSDADYSQMWVVVRNKRRGLYKVMQLGAEKKTIFKPYRYLDAHTTFDRQFRCHVTESTTGGKSQKFVFEYATEKQYRIRQVGAGIKTFEPMQRGGYYRYVTARISPASTKGEADKFYASVSRIVLSDNQLWQFEKVSNRRIHAIKKAPGVPVEFAEALVTDEDEEVKPLEH